MRLGLDIGSTTIKCVVLDDDNKLIYSTYERHFSQITDKIAEILDRVRGEIDGVENALVALRALPEWALPPTAEFSLCRRFLPPELPRIPLFPAQML